MLGKYHNQRLNETKLMVYNDKLRSYRTDIYNLNLFKFFKQIRCIH